MQQGIIIEGQREAGSGAGEAYSIMLDDSEGFRRRYPARLKSLRGKKAPRTREQIDEKMRLADERRKSKEDALKTRLRAKSARIRGPAPVCTTEEDEDATITPVVPLQLPVSPARQIGQKAGEEGEWVRKAGGDGREKSGPAPVCTTEGDEDATITPVVRIKSENSSVDLNDPAAKAELLKKLQDRLKGKGVTLKWREQPDGKVFHKERKREKKEL
ncbi:uncharacterized protein LOC114431865 [Parambassis ranga]|uniref:Uncharacterized protein LOC114431865 n=1 Tax=Parambassis ranga TaxID=210632 RepID=A0A6P7HTG3_9TELE|nr:uncharacterized protein LOC114431865 [Parambassis ranga]